MLNCLGTVRNASHLLTGRILVTLIQVTLLCAPRLNLMVTLRWNHLFFGFSFCVHTLDESPLHSTATGR